MNEEFPSPFILQRADPFITRHKDGLFYFTASVPDYDRIVIRSASAIRGLKQACEHTVWERHANGSMSKHIWAPELHYLDGAWYIYFAAGRQEDIWNIRPYVLRCSGQDPLRDSWDEMGMLQSADEFSFNDFSLDMTVFEHSGKRYAVWAEKVNIGRKISNLYIAEMASPIRLKSEQVLLSTPAYDWERIGFWVNEGPAFICRGNSVHITYSASATGSCYCMGLLSAPADADLLDPAAWRKSRKPVLMSDAKCNMYGPGHNSFFSDETGTVLMAYHCRQYEKIEGDPLYDRNRHTYIMKVDWNDDNPIFCYENNVNF